MKQRILSFFLALLTLFGLFSTAAFAADTPEAALGEVNIYNGEHELDYLSINGAVKKQYSKRISGVLRQPDYPRRPPDRRPRREHQISG